MKHMNIIYETNMSTSLFGFPLAVLIQKSNYFITLYIHIQNVQYWLYYLFKLEVNSSLLYLAKDVLRKELYFYNSININI